MLRLARPARDEGGLVHQILVIIGISALSGVLIAGLALPWVGLISKGAANGAEAVQSFALKLHFKPLNERTRVLAADGTPLAVFYDENRVYVPLDKISPVMQRAIVAIEDSRFYQHGAIDVKGTLRALLVNQASSGVVQGGSSITQQLVKLTLLEDATTAKERAEATARSYARKVEELRYAVWVENHLSKKQILEHYLNAAYYGDGAYGIEAAAHKYFSTTAAKLTLPQAALLAGVVKNPTSYAPTNNPRLAIDRRDVVLKRMRQLHLISHHRTHKAVHRPLRLHTTESPNGCLSSRAPFFCDYLQQYLMASPLLGTTVDERRHELYGGGLTITSTIDLRFQQAADNAVRHHVFATDHAIGGMAMVQPGTGYVRALAQSRPMGRNSKKGQTFLNYVVPQRYGDSNGFQPGSTFKAFVLAQAIKDGIPLNTKIYSPSALTVNLNSFRDCDGPYPSTGSFTFHNSTASGTMDLYTGTQESVNTFFIQLEQRTGLCGPWHLAKEMGIELEDPAANRVPSFTLGVSDVSPLEMAEAYATFPARGVHCPSTPVLQIQDRNGNVVPLSKPKCNRVMKPAEADAVNDILRGVQEPGGFGYDAGISLNQPSAGKTGTVAPAKSVWFLGYTPTLVTASMIAGVKANGSARNLDNQVIGGVNVGSVHGSTTAGPMWYDAMKVVQRWLPNRNFVPPDPTVISGRTVQIPSFYGVSPQTAARELIGLGLKPRIASSVNSSAPYGTVAYTSPSLEAPSGQTVLIYLSNGYTPPPPSPTVVAPPRTTAPTHSPSPKPTPSPSPKPSPSPSPKPSPSPSPSPKPSPSPSPGPTSHGNGHGNGHGHGNGNGHGH